MRLVIDRFEGEFAVCQTEDGNMVDIKKHMFPKGAVEGDVLILQGDKIAIDLIETKRKKEESIELVKDLFIE